MRPRQSPLMWLFLALVSSLQLTLAARAEPDDPVALSTVLTRAGQYVALYLTTMEDVVAEERYVQDLAPTRPRVATFNGMVQPIPGGTQHRELRSEIAMMNAGPSGLPRMYRDVFEVNGKQVRERDTRLARLVLSPAPTARDQAERIADESARFNLSVGGRWLNEPGLPLLFLQTSLRPRCEFSVEKQDKDEWIIKFQERARPTLFRQDDAVDMPTSGRFWINPISGIVHRSELAATRPGAKALFTTTFRHDDRLGIAVPEEMREVVTEGVQDGAKRLEAVAKYTGYRTFSVNTEEHPR